MQNNVRCVFADEVIEPERPARSRTRIGAVRIVDRRYPNSDEAVLKRERKIDNAKEAARRYTPITQAESCTRRISAEP